MRLSAAIRRTEATDRNVNNAQSFLSTQDGVLEVAGKVLARLAELAQLNADVTKTTNDTTLYKTEFDELVSSIDDMGSEVFNGTPLFVAGGSSLSVITSQDGNQTMGITQANLDGIYTDLALAGVNFLTDDAATTISTVDAAINDLATLRAQNGAEQSRLSYVSDILEINQINLEAANSRIMDLDVAKESSNLARFDILQRAGIAVLAQANQTSETTLKLLY